MLAAADYRVSLDAFEGPLDLLLFLIRRAEVDIHDIPVGAITDQYLGFISQLDDVDVEAAGEFLVMAASLVELKTRTIAPPAERDDESTEGHDPDRAGSRDEPLDPRAELVRQLIAYQRYRVASEDLEARRQAFANRHALRPGRRAADDAADEDDAAALELDDVHVLDLAQAYERIVSSIDFRRLGEHVVEMDDTPIALHQADLLDRLRATPAQRITLQQTFAGRRPQERIGLFLATLELVRMRTVTVRQDAIDREIELELVEADADATEESEAASPADVDDAGASPDAEA